MRDEPTKGERVLLERALRAVVGEPESDAAELTLFDIEAIVAESA